MFSETEQAKEEFPRTIMMYNMGIKRRLNQEKAIQYFKEKAREIRAQSKEEQRQFGEEDKNVFEFIAARNE